MTRAGKGATRPEMADSSPGGGGTDLITGRSGAGGVVRPRVGTSCDGGFCGKRGVVLALAGAPVMGGAEGF